MPTLVSENQPGAPEAPVGRARECLFKKRQTANHNEICNCPSVAQIKNFPLPLPRISLTTVQWSNLMIGRGDRGLNRLLSFGGSSWNGGEGLSLA
jgi:hypothetical protein